MGGTHPASPQHLSDVDRACLDLQEGGWQEGTGVRRGMAAEVRGLERRDPRGLFGVLEFHRVPVAAEGKGTQAGYEQFILLSSQP